MSDRPRVSRVLGLVLAVLAGAALASCSAEVSPTWTMPPAPSPGPATPSPSPTVTLSPSPTPAPATPSPSVEAPSPSASPGASPGASPSPVAGGWSFVKEEQCPDSRFQCVTLAVPSDHFTAGSPTWEITFAIQRAKGKRLGTFVMNAGGPGGSGISVADSYTDGFPTRFVNRYDMVFPDQRGIGLSHPIYCFDAAAAYYASPADPRDPAQAQEAGQAAKDFVGDCLEEAGVPEADLPLYSTAQAIEDLEAIREYLEVDRLDVYGESYGTQFSQAYATRHPEHVRTLYLDGPVDLTLDGATFYAEASRAFDDVLVGILNACRARPTCLADFEGRDPLAVFDDLQARLREASIDYDFPLDDGTRRARSFTAGDLQDAVIGYLYSEYDRAMLLRALAASADGNMVPLAHLAAGSILVDPDTQASTRDRSWSDALYYAVECQDYVYSADASTDEQRLQAFLDAAKTLGITSSRVDGVYYGDMPCLYWPNRPATDPRPAAIVDPPYPTWISVATADPITPPANAMRLASRLQDVHVIMQTGGPHVIFGWGKSCPDDIFAAYLVDGKEPANRVTVCNGRIVDPYVPLARDEAADYPTALSLMRALTTQLEWTNDYAELLDEDPIDTGCDFGGVVSYRPGSNGTAMTLHECELIDGLPVSGTGRLGYGGGARLDVTFPDGSLRYTRRANGDDSVEGTFRGARVR